MPKSSYDITPQIGYGPIKFGMSSADVHEVLGAPVKVEAAVSKNETDEEEILYYGKQVDEWYGNKFPNDTDVQVTFESDKTILITIFKRSKPLLYKGLNLHSFKKREDILEALAKDEDVYYYDQQGYFFPKSGLVLPSPKNMKRFIFIQLVLTDYMMPRLNFEMYEPSTALD